MSTSLLDSVQTLLHSASVVVGIIIVCAVAIGLVKPQLFATFFQSFAKRKYITVIGVFLCLLSGTVFIATEPMIETPKASDSNKQTIQSIEPLEQQQVQQQPQSTIRVDDVRTVANIPFASTQIEDATLPKGQTKITQVGVAGKKEVTYTVTYDKDIETSRSYKSERVTVQPITQITAIGTLVESAPVAVQPTTPAPVTEQPKTSGCHNSRSWVCMLLFRN